MHLLNISFREMAEICNDLKFPTETKDLKEIAEMAKKRVNRIIAEKEGKDLSYTDLADLLNKIGSTYSDNRITLGETIRKGLDAKKPDEVLLEDLCKALNIPAMTQEELIFLRHFRENQNIEVKPGRISDEQKRANKELYEESRKYASSEDDAVSMEEMVLSGMEYADYEDLKELELEEEILAKLTMIYRNFPGEVCDFLHRFEFDKEDIEELKRYHVEVSRRFT